MGFADFHLLLVRAGVELLLARSGQLCEGRVFPQKMGWGSPPDQQTAPPEHAGGLACLQVKAEIYFQGI